MNPVSYRWRAALVLAFLSPLAGCHLVGVRTYRVVGKSMEPLLHEGDRILVSETYYKHHPLEDGDVIVFRHDDRELIKRVVALSGEMIEGRQGVLLLEGRSVREPYVPPVTGDDPDNFATFPARKVPEGQVFVAGDNRPRSLDSRSTEYGSIRIEDVIGKFMGRY